MNIDQVRLLGNRILVKMHDDESTVDGFVIVQEDESNQTTGTVVVLGDDVTEVKMHDTVMFNRYSGTMIMINDECHRVIAEPEVLLIIR